MSRKPLEVHLYGTHVGDILDSGDLPTMRFSPAALTRWGVGSRVISHILPLDPKGPHPRLLAAFLKGFLPEGRERTRHAERAGVVADDLFGMMSHYGRDTVGGLDIRRGGEPGDSGGLRPVSATDISTLLTGDPESRDRIHGRTSRTSIQGLQPKIGVTRADSGWTLPHSGALSTHIIKLGSPAGSPAADVIHTEAAVLELARLSGLGAPRAWIESIADEEVIVVERFDRVRLDDGRIGRLHQEDGAQALAIDTDDPDRKFQRGGRDLPSWRAIARTLVESGTDPDALASLVTFRHAVGDVDFHAKNVSFRHHEDGSVSVAPVYDAAMHMHEPDQHSGHCAIHINGKRDMAQIGVEDLVAEAQSWGLAPSRSWRAVTDTLDLLTDALDRIDRTTHPGVPAHAWEVLTERLRSLTTTRRPVKRGPAPKSPQARIPRGRPGGGRFTHTSQTEPGTEPR